VAMCRVSGDWRKMCLALYLPERTVACCKVSVLEQANRSLVEQEQVQLRYDMMFRLLRIYAIM